MLSLSFLMVMVDLRFQIFNVSCIQFLIKLAEVVILLEIKCPTL